MGVNVMQMGGGGKKIAESTATTVTDVPESKAISAKGITKGSYDEQSKILLPYADVASAIGIDALPSDVKNGKVFFNENGKQVGTKEIREKQTIYASGFYGASNSITLAGYWFNYSISNPDSDGFVAPYSMNNYQAGDFGGTTYRGNYISAKLDRYSRITRMIVNGLDLKANIPMYCRPNYAFDSCVLKFFVGAYEKLTIFTNSNSFDGFYIYSSSKSINSITLEIE